MGESECERVSYNEEGWKTVNRRKGKEQTRRNSYGQGRMDIAANMKREYHEDTVSFYFTEIPDSHGAREMLTAFQIYGKVVEVVIPQKRNKRGRRFGFARIRDVRDPRTFAVKLDNIIIGAKKIHVNLPRFQRDWNEVKRVLPTYQKQKKYAYQPKVQTKWQKEGEGSKGGDRKDIVSYANAVKYGRRQTIPPEKPKVVYYRKSNIVELCYNVSEEDMRRCNNMYVGVVKTPSSTHSVQERFSMQGFFSIKVTPLGANKVLLEEMDEGIIQDLISDANEWIHEKFDDIRGWSPAKTDNERVVWVRCHGIPAHAWKEDFFSRLASKFSVFLGVNENTRKKTSMDTWQEFVFEQKAMTYSIWWFMLTSMGPCSISKCLKNGAVQCIGLD